MEADLLSTKSDNANVKGLDLHQKVTDTIIQQLEKGTVPWQQPWINNSKLVMTIPKNAATGNQYRGINIVLLWSAAIDNSYQTSEWASFKQWQNKKESVRKGEKGNLIVYYDTFEKEVDSEIKKIPFLKYSYVFNRCQLNSYVPEETSSPIAIPLVQKIDAAENYVRNTKAIIENSQGDAYYKPGIDKIYMPPVTSFIDTQSSTATEGYYAVLFHELTHWTGHQTRLDRQIKNKFGNDLYAEEELTAELGAAFLAAEIGIVMTDNDQAQHASYIANWLTVLKQNKQLVFKAASNASKAVEYIQSLQPSSSL